MTSHLTLPNDRNGFAQLRALAEGFAAENRFSDTMGHRLMLILEELFTNVHKYGHGASPAGAIDVRLTRDGDRLLIEFADDGGAFDPLSLPKPKIDRDLDERPVGGLGVHIVRSMASSSRYERADGWNRLRLVCAIRP